MAREVKKRKESQGIEMDEWEERKGGNKEMRILREDDG